MRPSGVIGCSKQPMRFGRFSRQQFAADLFITNDGRLQGKRVDGIRISSFRWTASPIWERGAFLHRQLLQYFLTQLLCFSKKIFDTRRTIGFNSRDFPAVSCLRARVPGTREQDWGVAFLRSVLQDAAFGS